MHDAKDKVDEWKQYAQDQIPSNEKPDEEKTWGEKANEVYESAKDTLVNKKEEFFDKKEHNEENLKDRY